MKKLFRGLKKAVKAVLPVVAKVLLTPIVGPVAASAIVDGASAVIQGGSLKDGLKAAAIGGISSFGASKIGGARGWAQASAKQLATESAISTALQGGNPRDILKSATVSGIAALGTQAVSDRFLSKPKVGDVQVDEALLENYAIDPETQLDAGQVIPQVDGKEVVAPTTPYPPPPGQVYQVEGPEGIPEMTVFGSRADATPVASPEPGNVGPQFDLIDSRSQLDATVAPPAVPQAVPQAVRQADATLALEDLGAPTIGESFDAIITGGGQGRVQGLVDLFAPNVDRADVADYLKQQGQPFDSKAVTNFIKENRQELGMGALRRYGPIGAGSLALAALSAEEVDPMDLSNRMTGMDLIRQNPEMYRVFDPNRTYIPPRYTVTSSAGSNFQPTPLNQPQTAAQGGEIMYFPRMDGPIEGPGTETSDDIPAMLSDGEFVFTAKAVRGAGRGSREDGMKNMYKMMRQFEARV